MELYQVLGKYITSLEHPFDRTLFGLDWDYREPYLNRDIAANIRNGSNSWHQDNFGTPPWLLVWTDAYPTEIELPDGNVVSGEPYDVVLLNNNRLRHRTPSDYLKKVRNNEWVEPRHFARCNIDIRNERYELVIDDYLLQEKFDEWKRKLVLIESTRQ